MSDPEKFSRCKNVLEVLYYHAEFGGVQISAIAEADKNDGFFVCHCVRRAIGL